MKENLWETWKHWLQAELKTHHLSYFIYVYFNLGKRWLKH